MKFLIFLGSVRTSTPPRPALLGERVAQSCLNILSNIYPEHRFELIDPLDYAQGPIFKPHFAYAKSKVPQDLDALADKIQQADGYVMVSPEYNHSMSPALANLLNHFGSSLFSFKPSAIVTYSAGQWGGMRAAVGMRTFLGELGCLPVSAMIHVPKAQEVLDESGAILKDSEASDWQDYFARTFHQLIWWAEASTEQRHRSDPFQKSAAFQTAPAERNAPHQ